MNGSSCVNGHAAEQIAATLTAARPLTHDEPFIEAPGLRSDGNGALAARLAALAGPYGGGRLVGVPYGTDAPFFAQLGAPTVVFGPGSIKQAHTRDEWIEVEQLDAACRVLAQFVADA
jgi:acetylornithine deacetylase